MRQHTCLSFAQRPANAILAALPATLFEQIQPLLVHRVVPKGKLLIAQGGTLSSLYFLEAGAMSMIVTMDDGRRAEVGMIGHEGVAGVSLLLGAEKSVFDCLALADSTVFDLYKSRLHCALSRAPALQGLLLRYTEAFHRQVSQTAACNVQHSLERRLARWLLMMADRIGEDLPLTQELLAMMLGVQRPSVTLATQALERAGYVRCCRGRLTISDRPGLEVAACECYQVVRGL